ncbi:glycosyltransferase family 2 protein [Ferviditalea candida]|uniref:Glycosyltransferase family 2 protein n=1 Tax=Ferviditalea candida TaxID=3108399 RepID=A0ABU5ZFT0_9BACL|nr:glycosyltransferase family 2 protein [Paenibacillaceae bacterium T2]
MGDTLVIIPAFNEEKLILQTLQPLLELKLQADVLVINDGSTDHTGSLIRGLPIYRVNHPVNLGYGAALQSGFQFAAANGYRYVVQFDADGQHDPEDLKRMIEEIHCNDADVVIGSRFLGNPRFNPGWMKSFAIRIFRAIIYVLSGKRVTDPTSGLRGLSARVFRYYSGRGRFPSDFPDADIIIHMLLNRFTLREFPIGSRERKQGTSMHSGVRPVIYIFKVTLSILAVILNHNLNVRRDLDA